MVYQYRVAADGHDQFTYLSQSCETIFELPSEACVTDIQQVWNLVHPEDLAEFRKSIEISAAELSPWVFDSRLLMPDGRIKWINGRALPLRTPDGSTTWNGIILDITERKQTELAKQATDLQLQNLIANIPGAVFRYILRTDQTHAILCISAGCQDLWELPDEVALADVAQLWAMVHPEDVEAMYASILESAANLTPWRWIWRITTPSGRKKWLEASGQPQRQSNGDTVWDTVISDVTERKQLEQELVINLARFEQLNRNVPAVVYRFVTDPLAQARVIYISDRASEIFSLPQEECWNIHAICALIDPRDREAFHNLRKQCLLTSSAWQKQFRITTPAGERKWLEISAQPTAQADGSYLCDGVILDITARKKS
ncbi:MAG: PAS domain-containing protein [Synechococcaceae cyanobacterium SM2_3_60]|nr:PAS domain-containing protein [Synechococcaceae cyanobacterium SM2_3_60]